MTEMSEQQQSQGNVESTEAYSFKAEEFSWALV